jgi:hypothetical protein
MRYAQGKLSEAEEVWINVKVGELGTGINDFKLALGSVDSRMTSGNRCYLDGKQTYLNMVVDELRAFQDNHGIVYTEEVENLIKEVADMKQSP